ncbi:acyltransferase [Achromobacter sp. SIMBA_011]|jgi:peptidoglycan/LPS O-acetylase OafA/YrhL|nr:acyltransferase [Achromobacter dolens]MCZ8407558.1 acyltransferase [Achromobacter dolens]
MICGWQKKRSNMADIRTRIEYLDWLRALAVAMVVLGHSANAVAPGGRIGVSIFFVLSGFLIADILLRDGIMTPGNVAKFIVRRVGRIYPMYAFQLCAILVYYWIFNPEHLGTISAALRPMVIFRPGPDHWFGYGIGVLWTLRIEFWFYVTFPLVLWLAFLLRRPLAVLTVFALGSVLYKLAGGTNDILQYYDQFLLGSITAYLVRNGLTPAALGSRSVRLAMSALLLVMISILTERGPAWQAQSLATAIATAVLILSLHARPPTMHIPALSFIGAISYSMYLVHAIVLDCWIKLFGMSTMNVPLFLAITIVVSWLTYRLIEQPCQNLIHRYVRFSAKPA